jgi:probable rRNA maturation factor
MAKEETFSISNSTKGKLPRLPFDDMKNAILGKRYSVHLAFIGEQRSRRLNNAYREKDKPTNVLAFPLDTSAGDIFITPSIAAKQAAAFGKKPEQFIGFLFIHALLHLKGYDHGSRMEHEEAKFARRFNV